MSDQDQKLTEILDLLHGVPEHEEEETLRELRRSDRPLHERVVAELELMRVARAAIPTPSGNPTVDVDSRHARAGSSFAGYTIESCIGVGGMGSVYRAIRRTPFQQSVAIKVLHPLLATEAFRRRFEIEQRALASLDHPAIASILDAGEFDGSPYLIMELVDGVPIDQFCQESGASLNDKIRMTELIANAMQHAHDRGVIHRDIKPSNLLVRTVDGVPAVTVIDFGIARLLGEDTNSSDRPTVPMGTPVFASPEQSDSSAASATVRSDIYSLGATLRYLLEPPGDGSWSASRQDVKAVVAKATSQHPNDRYSSAAEFAGDLRRLQDRVPVRARPIGVVTRSLRWAQRHPAGSSLGLAVVVLIIAASLAALRSQVTETQRQAATEAFEETQGYYLGTLLGLAHSRELGTNTRIRELIDSLTRERQSAFTDISDSGLRASARAEMLLGLATLWIDLEDSELALLLLAESEDAARRGGVFHGDLQIDTLMRRIDAARRQQDIGLAITSGEEAVRLATLEHGADSRRVSQIGTYLGLALVDAQDWDRAREVLEQSLAIDQRRLGADHIETIRSRGNLAFLSMRQGDPVAAATMYANLIDLLERTGRSSSVDMYLFQRQLGSLYVVLERFEEAEPLLRDAIAGMTKLNGVAHAEVIRPSIRLADAIAGLGRADEALPLYDAAVDAAEDGRLNWLAGAEAVRSKAQTLTQLGRQVEAIETLDRGTIHVRRALGNEHSALIGLTGQLAKAYRTTGQHALAIPLYEEAVERSLRFANNDSTNNRVLTNRNNLANGLLAAGQPAAAAEQFRAIAEIAAETQPETLLHGWALRGLGRALTAGGAYEEAERALIASAHELQRVTGDPDHPRTQRAILSLIDLYDTWASGASDQSLRERALAWEHASAGSGPWPE